MQKSHRIAIFVFDALLLLLCLCGTMHLLHKPGLPAAIGSDSFGGEALHVRKVFDTLSGLAAGDTILRVAGTPVRHAQAAEFVIDAYRPGDTLRLDIQRGALRRTVDIALVRYYSNGFVLSNALVGCVFFCLGLFVLYRRAYDETALYFHWTMLAITVRIMTTWGYYDSDVSGITLALRFVFGASFVFFPAFFLHFTLLFPFRKHPRPGRVLLPLYLLAAGLSVLAFRYFAPAAAGDTQAMHNYLLLNGAGQWLMVAGFLAGLFSLIHSYRGARMESQRKQVLWILYGFAVGGIGFMVLWQIPQMLTGDGLAGVSTGLLFSAVIPLTCAIAIVRHQALDIDVLIQRSTVYSIVVAILLGVYTGLVYLLFHLLHRNLNIAEPNFLAAAFSALVIALLFQPLHSRVQAVVDKRFFRIRYNFRQAQRHLVEAVQHALSVQEAAEALIRHCADIFGPVRMVCMIYRPDGVFLDCAVRYGDVNLPPDPQCIRRERFAHSGHLAYAAPRAVEPGIPTENSWAPFLERTGYALLLPAYTRNDEIPALLALGPKKSGFRYTAEDMDLLRAAMLSVGQALVRIQLQERLFLQREEARRLRELSAAKSFFVSSVSHELKTPLTSIRMFAEILRNSAELDAARQREYAQIIEGEATRLGNLIGNVLNFGSIERGSKHYHFEELDPRELIEEVLTTMHYQLRIRKAQLRLDFGDTGEMLRADRQALFDCLVNLLSNALKYSPAERVEIAVQTSVLNNMYCIQVCDKGHGIAARDIEHIFTPFYRVNDTRTHEAGGTGLGLALVQDAVSAHGGRIAVSSTPGQGSCFSMYLPLQGAD